MTVTRHFAGKLKQIALLALMSVFATGLALGNSRAADIETLTKPAFTDGSAATVDHATWDALLKAHVMAGADGTNRIGYAGFKAKDQAALKSYIKALETVQPTKLGRNEAFAFWANLYNAKTIDIVLDAYPVKSIKDINLGGGLLASVTGGPWKAKVLKVAGVEMSLDDIEHGLLRPVFKDPRIHYAVNCASIGCPNLSRDAFTGATLDTQLDAGAKAYVNSPRGVRADPDGITASSIYNWFVADFGGDETGVIKHLKRYADPLLKPKLESITEIADYGYDWTLNDVTSIRP